MWQYYGELLSRAWETGFGGWRKWITLVGLAVNGYAWERESPLTIPWPILIGTLLAFFFLAIIKENYQTYCRIEGQCAGLREELETIRRARPKLTIARCACDQRAIVAPGGEVKGAPYVMSVYVINDPPSNLGSPADDVYATIEYDDGETKIAGVYGRWGDSDQPALAGPFASIEKLNAATIKVGATRELNIAVKFAGEPDCYAFDTTSLASGQWRRDDYRLKGEIVRVTVRLRAANVDDSFAFIVRNSREGAPAIERA